MALYLTRWSGQRPSEVRSTSFRFVLLLLVFTARFGDHHTHPAGFPIAEVITPVNEDAEMENAMFCPQCGAQSEQHTKFCRSCGLKLSDHAQLLPRTSETEAHPISPQEATRAESLLKSAKAWALSSILLPINLALAFLAFLMAISTVPREAMIPIIGLIVLLSCLHLCLGSLGFLQLIRSGFFSSFRQRLIRVATIWIDRSNLQPVNHPHLSPETNRISPRINSASVTEDTTLQIHPSASNPEERAAVSSNAPSA